MLGDVELRLHLQPRHRARCVGDRNETDLAQETVFREELVVVAWPFFPIPRWKNSTTASP